MKSVKKPTKKIAKVPVIMQLEALECGAACLTMILAYYDKWIPLEQVRRDCGVSRDGSKAGNVLKAARNYGLKAQGYRMELEALKENATFPCIIHWNFNHFVVLDGFKGDYAILNDPAAGRVKIPMKTFDDSFTGICLEFEPDDSFAPSGSRPSMLRYAKARAKGTGSAMAFVLLTSLITSFLAILSPVFSRVFMDYILSGKNPEWAVYFLGAFALLTAVQLFSRWLFAVYSLRIDGKLATVGSTSYMWKVFNLPIEFFSQRMAGDIEARKDTNEVIASTIVNTFAPLALDTFMMFFYLIIMVRYSVLLAIVGICSVLINLWVSRVISEKRTNLTRVMMRDSGKLYSATVSGIEMIETIKSNGSENGYFARWAGFHSSVNTQTVRFSKIDSYIGIIPTIVSSVADILVAVIGVYLVMNGSFTLGMVMAFQGFLSSFVSPATTLIDAGQTLQEMRADMERVEDVLNYPDDDIFCNCQVVDEYDKLSGSIELKNVTFGYSPLEAPLIEDFSLSIKPGQKVALVGSSGCGKSTISKLISGLYKPWSGEILFDGKPISEINKTIFKSSLLVVDQDIILFEDTLANNIKMWDKSIEDFEMILASRDAQIHDTIMQRGGYGLNISEGGRDFSGGQRQRMEIARVLASDPTIIVLDEATSALDARTEFDVVNAIKDRGISCVIVAHRLSTIRDCDEIIVLDNGSVVERGTHEELMKLNGYYTDLVTSE